MDEKSIQDFMKPKCPVKVGDIIWRKYVNMTLPDPLRIEEIIPTETGYNMRCRYLQHAMGPFERTYSDSNFRSQQWFVRRDKTDIPIVVGGVL